MRVKVRFNAEAGQSPIIVDLRFLPRIGEKINLGFRRVVEVLEVYRTDNDNRFAGIIRGRYVQEQSRIIDASPTPRPMPMPPVPIRSLGVSPPAQAQAQAAAQAGAAIYGDVSLEELAAAHGGKAAPETTYPANPVLTPDPAL